MNDLLSDHQQPPCIACGRLFTSDDRYCVGCGAHRPSICTKCDVVNLADAKFCSQCAGVLAAQTFDVIRLQSLGLEPEPTSAPAPISEDTRPPLKNTDIYALERDVSRIVAKANLQRIRAQFRDARVTLRGAFDLNLQCPPYVLAPVHELLGDMDAGEQRWLTALEHYHRAFAADPKRVSAEVKIGRVTVQMADEIAMGRLGYLEQPVMSADEAQEKLALATGLSLVVPGAGHLIMRQFTKGVPLLVAFVTCVVILLITQERSIFEGSKAIGSRAILAQTQQTVSLHSGAFMFAIMIYAGCLIELAVQSRHYRAQKAINPVPAGSAKDWDV